MKSFRYFIYAIVSFLIVLLLFSLYHDTDLRYLGFVFGVLGLIFVISSFLGVKNSIQSLLKKEAWTVFKIIGLVGNFITFGAIASLMIFNLLDIIRWYNGNWTRCSSEPRMDKRWKCYIHAGGRGADSWAAVETQHFASPLRTGKNGCSNGRRGTDVQSAWPQIEKRLSLAVKQ